MSKVSNHDLHHNGMHAAFSCTGPVYLASIPEIDVRVRLQVPFQVADGAEFVLGRKSTDQVYDPVEVGEHLYLLSKSRPIDISSLSQLRGKVTIKTPAEALAFCRLRTSPVTYYTFSGHKQREELEIVSRDQVDACFCFGDSVMCKVLSGETEAVTTSGYFGVVSSFKSLGRTHIVPAHVSETAKGFLVKRTVIFEHGRPWNVAGCVIEEFVGRDGTYARTASRPCKLPKSVRFSMPMIF